MKPQETFQHIKIQTHQTQMPGYVIKNVRNIIAIGSGKGGVGKSTIAANLATTLAQFGARVGLLDADIYGPSIPTMLGTLTQNIDIVDNRYIPIMAHGVQTMSIGYLTSEANDTLIWRGPMLAKALIQLLDCTAWDNLDYLLIDLPPGTGDIQLSLTQKIPLSGAIVVTTPQQVATKDAEKAIKMFEKMNIPLLGIVENMAFHQCEACGHQTQPFGEHGALTLAKKHHIPLLGQIPLHTNIREQADIGQPASTTSLEDAEIFANIALNFAKNLSQRPINHSSKFSIKVE